MRIAKITFLALSIACFTRPFYAEEQVLSKNKEQAMMNAVNVGATYEHYKSTPQKPMRYTVTGIARHSETYELMVTYTAHYDCGEYGRSWARPLAMFLEDIEFEGKKVPRFKKVDSE